MAPKAGSPKRDESSLILAVQTPLNFFALAALIVEGILGGLAIRAQGANVTYLVVGMMLIFLALVVGVVVITLDGQQEQRKKAAERAPIAPVLEPPLLPKGPLYDELQHIQVKVTQAAQRNVPILTDEVSHVLNGVAIESDAWSRGELNTPPDRYNSVLLSLYEGAKTSIFSTTIREYLADWPEELMEKMIAACEKSQAIATRVFIFAKRDEIDDNAVKIFERFKRSQVRSLVYIEEEAQFFKFSPDISRDFVVIDNGRSIGVTSSYGPRSFRARWFFGDDHRAEWFQTTCAELQRDGHTLDKIIDAWNRKSKSDGAHAD